MAHDPAAFRQFFKHYAQAMEDGNAALFIGAGLSREAGFVNWKELLKEIAEDLELKIDRETDLPAIAQYHANARSRNSISRLLIDEFTRDAKPTPSLRALAHLPVATVWTTNYDNLLERAYEEAGRVADVRSGPDDVARPPRPRRTAVIYKMHGDIDRPEEAVLLKEDYEFYPEHRGEYTRVLQSDFLQKTFLFVGFSFTDPNIDQILSRLRKPGRTRTDHYWIVREIPEAGPGEDWAEREYEKKKQELQIRDLQRYGINALRIKEYREIDTILETLAKLHQRKSVFVSGSAYEAGEFGADRLENFARSLGARLVDNGCRVVSGFGLGVGSALIVGAMEQIYRDPKASVEDRLVLRPFPQGIADAAERAVQWTRYRQDMLSHARFAVFLAGNKVDPVTGNTVFADGVSEEYHISREKGLYPIPVGATGYVARKIWEEVRTSSPELYEGADVAAELDVLGRADASDDELTGAILSMIQKTGRALTNRLQHSTS